jgi:hypothetical protein
MFSEENKAIIRRYLQDALAQIRSGNPHATDEFLTSDAAFHGPGPTAIDRPGSAAATLGHAPQWVP